MATTPTDTTVYPAFEPPSQPADRTVADLLDQLGGIPPERVRLSPSPGTATEKDVLSPSNTEREMQRKLREYFKAGAELVWYIDPQTQSAIAYTGPDQFTEIGVGGVLSGGDVLPGFELSL